MGNLPENIRNLRLMRGFSQYQLGQLLNKSANAVCNWEKGATSPDIELVEELCNIFRVTPNQIFGWDPCPELESFLDKQKEVFSQMDDLIKQKEELEQQIKECSEKLRKNSTTRGKVTIHVKKRDK